MKSIRFWAYFSAFLSLVISLAIVGYWICCVHELKVVNLNTFVGVTVALLGMIVTIAIAWQIYNAVDMRNKIRELKKLEDKLKDQEKTLVQLKFSSSAKINRLAGDSALHDNQMTHAFRFMIASLKNELQLEKPMEVDYLLKKMGLIADKIAPDTNYISNHYDAIIKSNEVIRSLSNYELIKGRYEYSFKKFLSKVKKDEK